MDKVWMVLVYVSKFGVNRCKVFSWGRLENAENLEAMAGFRRRVSHPCNWWATSFAEQYNVDPKHHGQQSSSRWWQLRGLICSWTCLEDSLLPAHAPSDPTGDGLSRLIVAIGQRRWFDAAEDNHSVQARHQAGQISREQCPEERSGESRDSGCDALISMEFLIGHACKVHGFLVVEATRLDLDHLGRSSERKDGSGDAMIHHRVLPIHH
jgi:hypothetical protein